MDFKKLSVSKPEPKVLKKLSVSKPELKVFKISSKTKRNAKTKIKNLESQTQTQVPVPLLPAPLLATRLVQVQTDVKRKEKEKEVVTKLEILEEKIRIKLNEILENFRILNESFVDNVLSSIYNYTINVNTSLTVLNEVEYSNNETIVNSYIRRAHGILLNFKSSGIVNNPGLLKKLLSKELQFSIFEKMTFEQMQPEKFEKAYKLLDENEKLRTKKKELIVSIIKCSKCKKNYVESHELFLRSGDEAGVVFNVCGWCGHRFKF